MIPIVILSNADVEELLGLPPGDLSSPTQSLIVTDSAAGDEPIIFANDAFSALTGYAHDKIIGRNCRFLQGRDTSPTSVAAIQEAIAGRRPFHGDILNYGKMALSSGTVCRLDQLGWHRCAIMSDCRSTCRIGMTTITDLRRTHRNDFRHHRSPPWIEDPRCHINVVGRRLHHQSP